MRGSGQIRKKSFEALQRSIREAPILINPNYSKHLLRFSFESTHTIVVAVLQKNQDGHEKPIAFFQQIPQRC